MLYMGGKTRAAKKIVQAIIDDGASTYEWFEPFVGGGNVMNVAAPLFEKSFGMDSHPDLMRMWSAGSIGWNPPKYVSRDEYYELKQADVSALRGYAGFALSFGGKWWGGYAGDHHPSGSRKSIAEMQYGVVSRQMDVFRNAGTVFRHGLFGAYTPSKPITIYCDPPYAGTTMYAEGVFDYVMFYTTLMKWARMGCRVYVSEMTIPKWVPHTIVWSRNLRVMLKKNDNINYVQEHLYRVL